VQGRSCTGRESFNNADTDKRHRPWSVIMATFTRSKLQFEEAYPNDWDAFNAWPSGPTAVTREDAARGLRRARRSGAVFIEGAHRYRLVGMNTVLLRPIQHTAGSSGA
jgi:hypothetical protein